MKSEFYGTEIFLDNEAAKEYLDICRKALKRDMSDEYHEKHEVIPPDFFRFLPGAGKLYSKAMPKDKRVYCPLTPEEHWKVHALLVEMFEEKTKQAAIAYLNLIRIKHTISGVADENEYGIAQRNRHPNGVWKNYPDEIYKYHPERFNGGH